MNIWMIDMIDISIAFDVPMLLYTNDNFQYFIDFGYDLIMFSQ